MADIKIGANTYNGVEVLEIPSANDDGYETFSLGSSGDEYANSILDRTVKHIVMPNDVAEIRKYMFYQYNNLETIALNDGITNIDEYAFYECNSLQALDFPDTLKTIKRHSIRSCSKLEKCNIPNGVVEIGDYAFGGNVLMELDKLPNSLITLGTYSFSDCTKITISELPLGVTRIGTATFYNCIGITSFTFHKDVAQIGDRAFGKGKMVEITFKGTPQSISSTAFNSDAKPMTINVPWSEGEVANAPWGATNATINYNYTGE